MTLKELQKYKQEIKIVQYSFKEQVNEKYKQWEVKLSKVQEEISLRSFKQRTNGSPVNPAAQLQIGL